VSITNWTATRQDANARRDFSTGGHEQKKKRKGGVNDWGGTLGKERNIEPIRQGNHDSGIDGRALGGHP